MTLKTLHAERLRLSSSAVLAVAELHLDSRALRIALGLILGRPSNFSWFLQDKIAASGLPVGERAYRWLGDHGVSAILCLTEDAWGEKESRNAGIEYKHIPMINKQGEIPAKLDQAVNYITESLDEGKRVLVHCQAGQGRTGMVLAAYLIKKEGYSVQDAIKYVREKRPGSLRRPNQIDSLYEYRDYVYAITKEENQ